jgi:uncharacterized DUF497 family protein
MEFEFDPQKSTGNKKKHGIDFHEAQALWDDLDRVEVPVESIDEQRSLVIGEIAGKHWLAVITDRNDKIRIISVRRARKREVDYYENKSKRF